MRYNRDDEGEPRVVLIHQKALLNDVPYHQAPDDFMLVPAVQQRREAVDRLQGA